MSDHVKPQCIIEGSRIIDIGYLSMQMSCDSCFATLCLSAIQGETKIGLASIWQVQCSQCKAVKRVYTSRKVSGENNRQVYEINGRAARCSIEAGIDHRQLMRFLASIDVPFPSETTLKAAQKRKLPEDVSASDDSRKTFRDNQEPDIPPAAEA